MSGIFGSSTPAKTETQIEEEKRQAQQSRKETAEKKMRLSASKRRRFGKQTLLSGTAKGISDTLGGTGV